MTLRGRLALLLGSVAVFLVVTLFLQLTYQNRLADERDELIHRLDVAEASVGALRTALSDQEGALRGYAISGDETYLAPYEQGGRDADAELDRLRELVGDDAGTAGRLDAVEAANDDWEASAATRADAPPADAAAAVADLEAGTALFSSLRADIDRLGDAIEADRADALDNLDQAFTGVLVLMFGQVGGLIILGTLIAVALSRQVVTPLSRLSDDARRVAQGDLGHRVKATATSPELVRLGQDVEAMRVRIVAEIELLTEARADLESQQAELLRSNDDLEQFAYVASHDLQEPLRKVSGFCQLLEKRYADQLDDRAKEYIWYANDGARRMQDLINDLLAFSRVGRTTEGFEPVDLGELTREAVGIFREPIEAAGATVIVGDLPTVEGDRRLLAQVIQNLLGNALKFRGEDPPRVEVTSVEGGDTCTVSFSDNGIGIPPEYADQIFTIFKRLHTKNEYDGTGIGLALSKKIVEFHGGHIRVDQPDGAVGTTVRFTLPHHPVAVAAATEDAHHDAD
jgi:signal transduction histidine kinase